MLDTKVIERATTDFGFVLIEREKDSWNLEAFGQTGIGRFELFFSATYDYSDTLDDAMEELLGDEAICFDVYRQTLQKLGR